MSQERPYHHRDLRHAVLTAAVGVIRDQGPTAVSLRDLARRAGVSHAAPAHHFGDKAGLLTAIAAEGHELLAAALAEARPGPDTDLADVGAAYVGFAVAHPAHFEVMYRTDLLRNDDPDLVAARAHAGELLATGISALPGPARDATDAALAAWSLAHGFATLLLTGSATRMIGDRDPHTAFRAVARHLFSTPD